MIRLTTTRTDFADVPASDFGVPYVEALVAGGSGSGLISKAVGRQFP